MRPDISVIIPTYNRLGFLQKAVASCFRNSDISVEAVVVDDGSTDGTWDWLCSLSNSRIRALRQKNSGPQVARNRGLSEAVGQYVKFLDDDDWLADGALSREVRALEAKGNELAAGIGLLWHDGSVVNDLAPPTGPDPYTSLVRGNNPLNFRFTMTADLAKRLGPRTVKAAHDVDFILRATYHAKGYSRVDAPSGYYRQHDGLRRGDVERGDFSPTRLAILCRLAQTCINEGATEERRRATQVGIWRTLHQLYIRDPVLCDKAWEWIERLDDSFVPPRSNALLYTLDRILGPMAVERLMVPARKAKTILTE